MATWDCCRTCLGVSYLNPIFPQPEYSEHYTDVILMTTGIKVEMKDNLPQQMCHSCIKFINESIKFRKKCEEAQQTLFVNKQSIVKLEDDYANYERISIDISDYIYNDFTDIDDNITLNNLQYVNKKEATNKEEIVDIKNEKVKEPKDIMKVKEVKRRGRKRKEETEKVKEVIECEYCHKILTSKLSIRNHYKIHTGFDVVCEHCGKKFITRRLLLMHCRAKHGYEKTDKCSYCDYKASNAEQVKIHERLHTGEKPYVCSSCGAGFHRKSSYLQHIAIHLPDKTVQCEQCPARFKSVTLMRIHASRHRAPRYTYQCGLCDNSFARRRNVARHVQRIHGVTPEPNTICRRRIT